MFGYLTPLHAELKVHEEMLYRAYYCGLCKAIGKCTGECARLGLSHDLTVLAVAGEMSRGESELLRGRCLLHPTRQRALLKGPVLDEAAALNTLLLCGKLRDDVNDGEPLKAAPLSLLYFSEKRAAAMLPGVPEIIEKELSRLSGLEKQGCDIVDMAADPFARLTGELYLRVAGKGQKPSVREAMRWMGVQIGRWIYLIDAYDDLARDREKGNYNVWAKQSGDAAALRETAEFALTQCLAQAAQAFELTGQGRNAPLMHNILYQGCAAKTNEVLTHPGQRRNQRNESLQSIGRF